MLAFRESLRSLRHSPAFAATAIAMLAVGIAVNTITVTLLNNLAFRLIPAADPDRLVRIYPLDEQGQRQTLVSHPDYRELRGRSSTLSDSCRLSADNGDGAHASDAGAAADGARGAT